MESRGIAASRDLQAKSVASFLHYLRRSAFEALKRSSTSLPPTKIFPILLELVQSQDEPACDYCEVELSFELDAWSIRKTHEQFHVRPKNLSPDRIVPHIRGGDYTRSNTARSCVGRNETKGGLEVSVFRRVKNYLFTGKSVIHENGLLTAPIEQPAPVAETDREYVR
ncbi:unnamed protein product [Sympodiomycopsis kandeliae]